jgi:hydrogenase maturation protease
VHEVSLLDLLSINRLTDDLPENRALIGIQPDSVDWGELPCDAVMAAIPQACDLAIDTIQRWQQS